MNGINAPFKIVDFAAMTPTYMPNPISAAGAITFPNSQIGI